MVVKQEIYTLVPSNPAKHKQTSSGHSSDADMPGQIGSGQQSRNPSAKRNRLQGIYSTGIKKAQAGMFSSDLPIYSTYLPKGPHNTHTNQIKVFKNSH